MLTLYRSKSIVFLHSVVPTNLYTKNNTHTRYLSFDANCAAQANNKSDNTTSQPEANREAGRQHTRAHSSMDDCVNLHRAPAEWKKMQIIEFAHTHARNFTVIYLL